VKSLDALEIALSGARASGLRIGHYRNRAKSMRIEFLRVSRANCARWQTATLFSHPNKNSCLRSVAVCKRGKAQNALKGHDELFSRGESLYEFLAHAPGLVNLKERTVFAHHA